MEHFIFNVDIEDEPHKENERIEIFRDRFLNYFLNKSAIFSLLASLVLVGFFMGWELSAMCLVLVLMIYFYMLHYPEIKSQKSYGDLNHELPYALRHMSIELKSGKGLHDCLMTIKNSDYGSISNEFNRVLEEVRYGKSSEESLLEMSSRVNSDGLSRMVQQIIGTLRVGGNLASSLEIIAADITFDMHIKLKEYSQRLNSFILIYTFIAILVPVISLVMLMASTTVMGDVMPSNIILLLYSVFFPSLILFMGLFIKKLEPKI